MRQHANCLKAPIAFQVRVQDSLSPKTLSQGRTSASMARRSRRSGRALSAGQSLAGPIPGVLTLAGPHASLFGAADARGFPGALPLDPFDDGSSSGTAGSPHGSESGFRLAPSAAASTRLSAAPHAPVAPGPSAVVGAGAGAPGAAAPAALQAVPAAPLALTEQELDALVRFHMYTPEKY